MASIEPGSGSLVPLPEDEPALNEPPETLEELRQKKENLDYILNVQKTPLDEGEEEEMRRKLRQVNERIREHEQQAQVENTVVASPEAKRSVENFDELKIQKGSRITLDGTPAEVTGIITDSQKPGGGYVMVKFIHKETQELERRGFSKALFVEHVNNAIIEDIQPPVEQPETKAEPTVLIPPEDIATVRQPEKTVSPIQPDSVPTLNTEEETTQQPASAEEATEAIPAEYLARGPSYDYWRQQLESGSYVDQLNNLERKITDSPDQELRQAVDSLRANSEVQGIEDRFDEWLKSHLPENLGRELDSRGINGASSLRYLQRFSQDLMRDHLMTSGAPLDSLEQAINGFQARRELLGHGVTGTWKALLAPVVAGYYHEYSARRFQLAETLSVIGREQSNPGLEQLSDHIQLLTLKETSNYRTSEAIQQPIVARINQIDFRAELDADKRNIQRVGQAIAGAYNFFRNRREQSQQARREKKSQPEPLAIHQTSEKTDWKKTKVAARVAARVTVAAGRAAGTAIFSPVVLPFLMFRHGPLRGINRFGRYLSMGLLGDSRSLVKEDAKKQKEAIAAHEAGKRQEALLDQARRKEALEQQQEQERQEFKARKEREALRQRKLQNDAQALKNEREKERLRREREQGRKRNTPSSPTPAAPP